MVTWAHANARNIVLPIAIFLRTEKTLKGIFGAEYKKVTKAVRPNHIQCSISRILKMIDPVSPAINKTRWILLLEMFHTSFSDGFSRWGGVRYQ